MTGTRAIQTFEVSLKVALFHRERLLLLQESDTGYWELPGGRIDVGEERLPHAAILAREISEELGPAIRYALRPEAVTWVRQRPTDGAFQFLCARLAEVSDPRLQLSAEHATFRWCVPEDWATLAFPPLSDYRDGLARIWDLRPSAK